MTRFFASFLLLTPLAVVSAPQSAQAQYWNSTYQQIGNQGFGTISDPRGNTIQVHQQSIGNTRFTTLSSPRGTVNCTTQYIGNNVFQNCY